MFMQNFAKPFEREGNNADVSFQ